LVTEVAPAPPTPAGVLPLFTPDGKGSVKKKYILKKTIYALITIFLIIVFNYFLFRILPGDPLSMLMRNPKASPEMVEAVRALYGLNDPWYTQFFKYLTDMLHGDLGVSFKFKAPVTDVIIPRILPTIVLLGIAEVIAIILGIFLGIIAAWKRGSRIDVGTLSFSLITYSMPVFWLAMIFVSIFSVGLHLFPVAGMQTPGMFFADSFTLFMDKAHHLILPAFTMGIMLIGEYALTMRNSLIDVLSEDYILTAKAKGFGERYVLKNHAVPNAMLPMITLITMNLGLVIGGAIQIETVFSWPGLGSLMYEALKARDYPLLQGVFLLVTVTVVVANYITDIMYSYIDPRVKE